VYNSQHGEYFGFCTLKCVSATKIPFFCINADYNEINCQYYGATCPLTYALYPPKLDTLEDMLIKLISTADSKEISSLSVFFKSSEKIYHIRR